MVALMNCADKLYAHTVSLLCLSSPAQGNILEDASAVHILSEAKAVSDDITAKQAVAEETQASRCGWLHVVSHWLKSNNDLIGRTDASFLFTQMMTP
jgi:hypothetical protein